MNGTTVGDLWRTRENLERAASAILGRAIFAFSRLDTQFGLMVASILRLQGKREQAMKLDDLNFHKRLEFVSAYLSQAQDVSPQAIGTMQSLLREADALRLQRNEMVHGRWDVQPSEQKVLNTVGMPNSAAQRTVAYTLEELEHFVHRLEKLQRDLAHARIRRGLP